MIDFHRSTFLHPCSLANTLSASRQRGVATAPHSYPQHFATVSRHISPIPLELARGDSYQRSLAQGEEGVFSRIRRARSVETRRRFIRGLRRPKRRAGRRDRNGACRCRTIRRFSRRRSRSLTRARQWSADRGAPPPGFQHLGWRNRRRYARTRSHRRGQQRTSVTHLRGRCQLTESC